MSLIFGMGQWTNFKLFIQNTCYMHVMCLKLIIEFYIITHQYLRYVLYKERNMLLTESNLSRRHGYEMVQSDRRKKVRKSMGAIKHVLGERKRAKIADHRAYLEELKRFDGLMADLNLQDDKDELEDAMHNEADEIKLDKE